MTDIERAKYFLKDGATVALVKDVDVFTTDRTGIAPLLELAEQYKDLSGFSAANKIVGRAEALLYAYMGAEEVYGEVMSKSAAAVLREAEIKPSCGTEVEEITENGELTAAEEAVKSVTDPAKAAYALRCALKEEQ